MHLLWIVNYFTLAGAFVYATGSSLMAQTAIGRSQTTNAATSVTHPAATFNLSTPFITQTGVSSSISSRAISNKWMSWSGNRIFYLVHNAKLEFFACTSFCKLAGKHSSLAVFGETVDPWFEDNGIIQSEDRYWVDKINTPNGCHYISASNYPRGMHCSIKYWGHDACKSVTLYKRTILKSHSCSEKCGCICQRRI